MHDHPNRRARSALRAPTAGPHHPAGDYIKALREGCSLSKRTCARTRTAWGPGKVTITTGARARAHMLLGRAPARLAVLAGAAAALAVAPGAASADIVEPPPMPHVFTVFPDRDFVSVEGYEPGESLNVRVLRNDVQIGAATGKAGKDGIFEVNHPGGACWTGVTPNIMARDRVVVAPADAPDAGEAT